MKTNMNSKNYFSILLASALALCGNAAWAKTQPAVDYCDWDSEGKQLTNATCKAYTTVLPEMATLESGWYLVDEAVTNTTGGIVVNGDVHLILCDEAELVVTNIESHAGIAVTDSHALTIYGQAKGTGILEASSSGGAGIGGNSGSAGGSVTVNGGTVIATGGYQGAGIGGGDWGAGGIVTVNGGTLIATGSSTAAGIGGGQSGAGGTVTINGGMVTANGGEYAAGIGGGLSGANGGIVEINGGTVAANGGYAAAGIGGGQLGKGGTVTINGGTVMANGGEFVAGIGGGYDDSVERRCDDGTLAFGAAFEGGILVGQNAANEKFMTQEAYTNDHGARFVAMPKAALAIPQVNGLVCTVSNETEEISALVTDGVAHYVTTNHATLTVGFELLPGFVYTKAPDPNPMTVPDVTNITYLTEADLPAVKSAVQIVLEKIFDVENTATTVELMYDESGVFAGHKVILGTDYGPLALSNDFGAVTIDLNGWAIKGVDGADSTTTAGGNGGAAITVAGECGAGAGTTAITVTNAPAVGCVQLWENGPYFATCNVGATKPEEYGYYFWWGDTVGYTNNGSAWLSVADGTTSIQFYVSDATASSTIGQSNSELKTLGYIDDEANPVLNAAHDAATVHCGAPWRMMTDVELQTLVNEGVCERTWTTDWEGTGKQGYVIKGKTTGYTDKSIFLPAAGYGDDFGFYEAGSDGYFWSSTPDSDNSSFACSIYFGLSFFEQLNDFRWWGYPVRPVRETADGRPASGSAAAIVGGKGGAGTPPGEGGAAIVDGAGNPMDITDPLGFVKKGEDGLPYVAQIVTDNGATTNLFTSVQDAFDSEFTANPAVTNTVTLLRDCTEIGTKIVKISSGKVVSDVALASMVLGDLVSLNLSGIGSRTVRLDLNGKTFVGGSSEGAVFPAVIVGEGSVLIIDDSDPEKKGVIARPKAVAHRSQLDMEGAAYLGATVATFGDVTLCRGKVKGEEAFCESGASETMGIVAWGASAHLTIAGGAVENADPVGEKRNLPAGTIVFNATFSMTGGKIKDAILAVGAKVSISGGLFGTDDVKNHPEWIAPDHICGENGDEATRAEGYNWAVFQPTEGSKWKPWKVGPEGSDYPQAHTNQNGELVIEGPGPVIEKPWEGGKDGITEITITDPGTELPDDVFRGMGGDDDKVKVNLPDNWKGELPDEDGNWYGAKAEIANAPFLVRNVKFLQRYPWNGLVDITADLMGYDGANVDIRVFNEKEEFKVKTLEGQTKDILFDENHRAKVHLVWDASMDVGNGFKSDAISIALFVKSAADLYYNNLMPELEHMDNDCQMKEEAAKALIGTDFESFRNDVIKFRAEMGKEIGTLQAAVVADYMASNLVANVSEKNEKVEALAGQIAMRNEMFTAQEGQIDAMRGQAEMQLQGLLMSQRNNAAPALEVKMRVIENKKGYAYETIRSDVNSYYNNYIAECQQLNEVIEKDYKDGCIIANQDKISNDIFALDTQLKKKLDEFESAIKAADQAEEVAQKEVDEKLKAVQQALDAAKKDTVENSAYSGADYSLLNEDVSRSLGNISSDLENISKQISQDKNDYAMADYRTQRLNVLEGLSNQITGQSMYFQEAAKRIAEEETATKKNLLGKVDFQRTNLGSAKAATIDKSDYSDSKYDEPRAAAASAFATCGEGIAGIVNEINTAYEEKSMKSAEQGIADKVNAIEGQILSIVDTFIAKVAEIDAAAQE